MDTPEPLLPQQPCAICRKTTEFAYRWEGFNRCRECLRDLLLRKPKVRKRQKLLRLLDGPDWAQGEFNWG